MHFCAWKCFCCSVFFSFLFSSGTGDTPRTRRGHTRRNCSGSVGAGWRARRLLQPGFVGSSFRPFLQWFGFQRRITFIFSFSICTLKSTFSFISRCFCLLAPMLRKPAYKVTDETKRKLKDANGKKKMKMIRL